MKIVFNMSMATSTTARLYLSAHGPEIRTIISSLRSEQTYRTMVFYLYI